MTEFEQMQIEQLKRIADVLEDINGTLISMGGDIESPWLSESRRLCGK